MPLNTFAIWLSTRFVICTCADSGVLGPGEKDNEVSFGNSTLVALVNKPEPRPRRAISEFYVSLPMNVGRSLESVPARPAAHASGEGGMLDDCLELNAYA